jgi:hypothetical protein
MNTSDCWKRIASASLSGGKHLSFDFVKPPIEIENRRPGVAAVRSDDAELTPVDPIDAGGNVELDLARLRQGLDRIVRDRSLISSSPASDRSTIAILNAAWSC